MFEPDLRRYPWGVELAQAAQRGAADVVRVARRARAELDDEEADAIGVELAEVFDVRVDPPGRIGALVAAAAVFAGPQTIARAGEVLRSDLGGAAWKVERGLEILAASRSQEAVIQLLLCAREAHEIDVMQRARAEYRGYPRALAELMTFGGAACPAGDVERYFALSLEAAMVQGTRYTVAALRSALRTPARAVLRRLIWARYDGRRPVDVFVIDPDDHALLDANYDVVELEPEHQVCVVHPAELAPGTRETWSPMLGDLEIIAPFPQLDRECVSGAEEFRFGEVGVMVDHWELCAALFRRGWTRDRESSVFGFSLRWASLDLNTQLQGDGRRRVDSLSLRQHFPGGSPSVESDVIQSEATAESIAILELFAPDALYL